MAVLVNGITRHEVAGSEGSSKPRKAVVFSQWTSMLDLIESTIEAHNARTENDCKLSFVRLDGKMSQQQREVAVASFNKDRTINLFLVSLKYVL